MTLYLHPDLKAEHIHAAAATGKIIGVKSYPRGVTTNSDSGIESYTAYYEVFEAMQQCNLVLMLHGEIPSDADANTCVMNAEERFLPHLLTLHRDFPSLRIVLEHATTAAAVDAVKSCGDTVAATITAHHLELVVDDWTGRVHNFCKPVAKFPHDRAALRQIVIDGHPRFFLGSDSAPHARARKETAVGAAGVFTSVHLLAYVATTLAKLDALERLRAFTYDNARAFYRLPETLDRHVKLTRQPFTIPEHIAVDNTPDVVVPFLAGADLAFTVEVVDGPCSSK